MENRGQFLRGEERKVFRVYWLNPHGSGCLEKRSTVRSKQIKVEKSKDKRKTLKVSINKKQVT